MYLSQACKPRQSVFDRSRRDVVLNISDLLEDRIDEDKAFHFFEENYTTAGMQTLIDKAFARLENRNSPASTFLLAQAMGGGKTHSMIALGLLAKYPAVRKKILGDTVTGSKVGAVKVIGFNGREADAKFGIWGELAERLGKKEIFNDHYSPLKAPGVSAWVNLLQGEPTLIFLDELPPYLENAKTIEIGNSDLSVATATAIANLLVAVDRPELANVCVVISDLTASWEGGSGQLNKAVTNLQNETGRSALRLEPVNSQGDELYHILRTRLFEQLPDESVIRDVANAYAKSVKEAKEMDVTNASPDSYAAQLVESYPFHFSMRDLYARFKENPGFQQTRGLIRLLRAMVANIYDTNQAEQRMLIHPYDLDLNSDEVLSEVKAINPSLGEAITHDIAKEGFAVAEQQDDKLGGTDFQDIAKLILVASLANIPNATHGLRESDIVGFLCAPGRDLSTIKKSVIDYLPTQAWYLHRSHWTLDKIQAEKG
jgi:predicted AAA+ superfamily ATPase